MPVADGAIGSNWAAARAICRQNLEPQLALGDGLGHGDQQAGWLMDTIAGLPGGTGAVVVIAKDPPVSWITWKPTDRLKWICGGEMATLKPLAPR